MKKNKDNIFKRFNRYLKLLSFKNLNYTIKGYGFNYSFGKYLTSVFLLMLGIVLSGYLFKLKLQSMIWLGVFSILLLPLIILSQIRYLYHNHRFEQITSYLQEMIIVFKIKPKIIYSLKEVKDIFTGGIKENIESAIEYIEKMNDNTTRVYENGLNLIEEEYPCSRIQSLHNLLITVETQNSVDYQDAINDLYEDIRAWITRTYQYQLELKNIKFQFTIIILLTIGATAAMVNILPQNMLNFINHPVYQTMTAFMLAAFLAMFAFIQSKLNGQWLVNDIDKEDLKILKSIDYVENFDKKKHKKVDIIKSSIFIIFSLIWKILFNNQFLMIVFAILAILMFFDSDIKYKQHFKHIKREITKTFPVWLRDVSLNMHNYVVTRAIKQSYGNAPTVLKYYLTGFLREIEDDPITIKPYNNFLNQFYINDISSSMKSLYSIKQSNPSHSSKQISDLIMRNQDLMEASERIRNQNQIAAMNMLGALPMIIGGLKLVVDMVLMIMVFMNTVTFSIG